MKRFCRIIPCFILFLAIQVEAQTNITDDITQDAVWNTSGSPYVVLNTVTIDQNVTLTINAGVTVKLDSAVRLIVKGTLLAEGVESNPITFTSNNITPAAGDWSAIRIDAASGSSSSIKFANFSYAQFCLWVKDSSPTIRNCEMTNASSSGIQIDGGQPIIEENDIHSIKGSAVFVGTGTPIIRNNVLHDNDEDGVHSLTTGVPTIHHNIIFGNLRYGINSSTESTIYNNTIDDNITAINCDNESPEIFNNIITNNAENGIRVVNGAAPVLSYNDTWNNTTDYFGSAPGTGDISLDARFVNQNNRDYRLQADSPCIDAGDPDGPPDADGTRADMGALSVVQTQVGVSMDTVYANPGDTLTIPVKVTDITELNVVAMQFDLTFDNTLLTPLNVIKNDSTLTGQSGWSLEFNTVEGKISVALAGSEALVGSGILAFVKFGLSKSALVGDSTEIKIDSLIINEDKSSPNVSNGLILIGLPWGDVSQNGVIQAFDASLILQYLTGLAQFTEFQKRIADVSGNKQITSLDASLILQFVVSLIDSFPVQTDTTENLVASAKLETPELSASPGDEISIPFTVNAPENLFSMEFTLRFDPDVLEILEVQNSSNKNNFSIDKKIDKDSIRIWLVSTKQFVDEDDFLVVRSKVKQSTATSSTVFVNNLRLNENDLIVDYDEITIRLNATAIGDDSISENLPTKYALLQNYPNPFNPSTHIKYAIPKTSHVTLTLYNLYGQEIRTLVDKTQPQGEYEVLWDGMGQNEQILPSGIYIARFVAGSYRNSMRLVLVK